MNIMNIENELKHTELNQLIAASTGKWFDFALAVNRFLPLAMIENKPSKEAIAESLVGQYGYKSLSEFFSEKLNFSFNTFRMIKTSYFVVTDNRRYLVDELDYSASKIRTLSNEFKRKEIEFPHDADSLLEIVEKQSQKAAENKRVNVKRLESEVSALKDGKDELRDELEAANARLTEQEESYSELEANMQRMKTMLDEKIAEVQKLLADVESMSDKLSQSDSERVQALDDVKRLTDEIEKQKFITEQYRSSKDELQSELEQEQDKFEQATDELKRVSNLSLWERLTSFQVTLSFMPGKVKKVRKKTQKR